jgi:hypothetical protein
MSRPAGARITLTDPSLQRALEAIEAAACTLSGDDWQRARGGQWNCAQIFEHLGKAYGSTAYILDKCVADGAPKGKAPSWRQWFFAGILINAGYFPTGIKAPEVTRPTDVASADALAYARETLSALDAAAVRCEARFGAGVRVANHPILGGFTIRQWRRFHWLHTRHHMRQIAQRRR